MKIKAATALIILALCALAYSTWSFYQNVHPWKLVKTISNGHGDDAGSRGDYMFFHRPSTVALSPDGTEALLARPNGTCDVLDIASKKVVATVGTPISPDPELEYPGRSGSYDIRWLPSGNILITNGELLDLYDTSYNHLGRIENTAHFAHIAVSPDETNIVESRHSLRLWTPENGELRDLVLNGSSFNLGSQEFDWFSDSKRLLLHNSYSLHIYDVATGDVTVQIHPIDPKGDTSKAQLEELPKEHYNAAYGLSYFVDARLFSQDQKIVTIHSDDMPFRVSQACYLRTYSTKNGELISQVELPDSPRSLTLSKDGTRAYVMMVPDFNNLIHVYDLETLTLERAINFKGGPAYPNRFTLLDETTALVHNNNTFIVDLTQEAATIKLKSENTSCLDAVLTSDGNTLITSGKYKTINIWEKQREPGPAHHLWQYWVSHASALVTLLTLTVTMLRNTQQKPTKLLTVSFTLLAIFLAIAAANLVMAPAIDNVWHLGRAKTTSYWVTRVSLLALLTMAMLGTLKGKDGWRIMGAFLSLFIVAVLCYVAIRVVQAVITIRSIDASLLQDLFPQNLAGAGALLAAVTAFYALLFYVFISKKHARALCQASDTSETPLTVDGAEEAKA